MSREILRPASDTHHAFADRGGTRLAPSGIGVAVVLLRWGSLRLCGHTRAARNEIGSSDRHICMLGEDASVSVARELRARWRPATDKTLAGSILTAL